MSLSDDQIEPAVETDEAPDALDPGSAAGRAAQEQEAPRSGVRVRAGRSGAERRAVERLEKRETLVEAAIQAELATGRTETTIEEAKRHVLVRLATIAVGFVVLFGGLVMMVLPGPGILGILAGLGILSRELPWAERVMEYVTKRAKLDELKEQPKWVQALMWTITAAAVIGSAAYFLVIR